MKNTYLNLLVIVQNLLKKCKLESLFEFLKTEIKKDKYSFVPFLPIFTMFGIILFFRYNFKYSYNYTIPIFLLFLFLSLSFKDIIRNLSLIALFITIGIIASKHRVNSINHHPVKKRMDNIKIIGTIDQISFGLEKGKLILQNLEIEAYKKKLTPEKIQFKINPEKYNDFNNLKPSDKIEFTANIFPLPKPVYPDAYNFSDVSRYKNIGGIGVILSDINILKKSEIKTFHSLVEYCRNYIDNLIAKRMNYSSEAGISMALMTGNTGYIKKEVSNDVRKAGLSHILAISGIHISIVAFTAFIIIRKMLSLNEYLVLHYNIKKIAAILSIIVSFSHLQISGLPLSAIRSFTMFTLGLICVLLDRSATPLRIISLTFFIIILNKPESILNPSLQMSFMAVLGLISTMKTIQKFIKNRYGDGGRITKSFLYFLSIFFASLVSTIATMPYTIYHFNQYSNIGLLSNIIAVPLGEIGMIPLGVIGIFASLVGFDYPFLKLMQFFAKIFIKIAHFSANVNHSYFTISEMPMNALFFYTIGILTFCILISKIRYISIIFILIGLCLHITFPKAKVVIGKMKNDLVFLIEDKYYSLNEISSDFTKGIWSGRLGQEKIEIIPSELRNLYIGKTDNIAYFKYKNLLIYFIENKFSDKICKELNLFKGKKFIIDRLGQYRHKYECENTKINVVKDWLISIKGAYVVR